MVRYQRINPIVHKKDQRKSRKKVTDISKKIPVTLIKVNKVLNMPDFIQKILSRLNRQKSNQDIQNMKKDPR
jgi:hypothetical protein